MVACKSVPNSHASFLPTFIGLDKHKCQPIGWTAIGIQCVHYFSSLQRDGGQHACDIAFQEWVDAMLLRPLLSRCLSRWVAADRLRQ